MRLNIETLEGVHKQLNDLALAEAELAHKQTTHRLYLANALNELGASVGSSLVCLDCGQVRSSDVPLCVCKKAG